MNFWKDKRVIVTRGAGFLWFLYNREVIGQKRLDTTRTERKFSFNAQKVLKMN